MYMRSQGSQNFILFNLEIEATARHRQGEARRKKEVIVVMAEGDNRVLRDCTLLQASGITLSILRAAIEANNFKLNSALITFVEWDQFGGHPSDNPNAHLRKFLAKCDIIKLNGVSIYAIRLRLFPFSLRDQASD